MVDAIPDAAVVPPTIKVGITVPAVMMAVEAVLVIAADCLVDATQVAIPDAARAVANRAAILAIKVVADSSIDSNRPVATSDSLVEHVATMAILDAALILADAVVKATSKERRATPSLR